MLVNRSSPPGIVPGLFYDNVAEVIEWLRGAFGFEERFRYGPPDGVVGAQLIAGEGIIMVSASRTGQDPEVWSDRAAFRPPRKGEFNIVVSVHVEDVDRHFERAKRFGARIVHEPETYPFGERQYTAEDLAGHRWAFSQSVADVTPEDWGGTRGPAFELAEN